MTDQIDTTRLSAQLRSRGVDLEHQRLLITRFTGSEQEEDLTEPANCGGFGRIRHFQRTTSLGWPSNPLPIEPACRALEMAEQEVLRAQVFQNAICNWRCWYCYVPFELLSANLRYSSWFTATELLELYLKEENPPRVIDLSGGQPDLVPEWIIWMLEEVRLRGLEKEVYLWSDDNLSNDYFWRYLSATEVRRLAESRNYGRVCCFKGFDEKSFAFNTMAKDSLFNQQFELFERLLETGMDVYAYVTMTTPDEENVPKRIAAFMDKLQDLHINLPLRTIPLEIRHFTPLHSRLGKEQVKAFNIQHLAIAAWQRELEDRFSDQQLGLPIVDVSLRK